MAQEQNYQVNYSINVDASQGTKQVIAFGEAVGKSSVSCPLKPSDSAPLKHSTMPP